MVEHARAKLQNKKVNLIAANHVGGSETGFAKPDNAITLISADSVTELPKQNKYAMARKLIIEIAKHYKAKHGAIDQHQGNEIGHAVDTKQYTREIHDS